MKIFGKAIKRENSTNRVKTVRMGKRLRRVLLGLLCLIVAAGGLVGLGMWTSRYPDTINMGTACSSMEGMNHADMNTMGGMCQPGQSTPIAHLQAPESAPHMQTFSLTAQYAHLPFLGQGQEAAWTFNGTSPGPTLRVHQGNLVIVHVLNRLSVGIAIHWHGVAVPNSADGVAGVTQDAIKPGQSYTYRFFAQDTGTYWYHSHQESFEQTGHGLYGAFIVEPDQPSVHNDVDNTVAMHTWNGLLAFNMTLNTQRIEARPGQWVYLRLINTDNNPHLITLLGTPFQVTALDGHDLHGPTPLNAVPLSIDGGQRYDIRFRMPEQGPAALVTAKEGEHVYQKSPAVLLGSTDDSLTSLSVPPVKQPFFDLASYGQPAPDTITTNSHFDVSYDISLGYTFGFSNGRPGPVFTLNGQSFPHTPTLVVKPNQLVKLHFANDADDGIHPMHLHGHTFTILRKNGKPLIGSPIRLDTLSVRPHENYDVAFYANNPGLWMLHCHNLYHANHGMDMMVVYPNISTPYTIGNASGNFPD